MKKGYYAMTVEDGEGRHEVDEPCEFTEAEFDHLVSYGIVSETKTGGKQATKQKAEAESQ